MPHTVLYVCTANCPLHLDSLLLLVQLGDSYLTFTTSLDISAVLIPSLFNFMISSQGGSKKEVRNNTVASTNGLSEGFYMLISQKSLDIMHPNPSFPGEQPSELSRLLRGLQVQDSLQHVSLLSSMEWKYSTKLKRFTTPWLKNVCQRAMTHPHRMVGWVAAWRGAQRRGIRQACLHFLQWP